MSRYSTREVSELIGLKPDQVRHYVRRELIDPVRGDRGEYRFNFQ
ncbi:MAG: MerR family transcriptional regulator, partial [Pseudomonadales bacterium]